MKGEGNSINLMDDYITLTSNYVGDFHTHPLSLEDAIYNSIFSSADLGVALVREPKFKCIGYYHNKENQYRLRYIDTSDIDKLWDLKHDITRPFEKRLVMHIRWILARYNIDYSNFDSLEEFTEYLKYRYKDE